MKTDENRKLKLTIPGKNPYIKKGKEKNLNKQTPHFSIQRQTLFPIEISGKLNKKIS